MDSRGQFVAQYGLEALKEVEDARMRLEKWRQSFEFYPSSSPLPQDTTNISELKPVITSSDVKSLAEQALGLANYTKNKLQQHLDKKRVYKDYK